jgi:hypothetical protein
MAGLGATFTTVSYEHEAATGWYRSTARLVYIGFYGI